jgi:hypothetical protein
MSNRPIENFYEAVSVHAKRVEASSGICLDDHCLYIK